MPRHIVTGIKPYDFIDDNGQHLQGVKVYYLDNDPEDSKGAKGYFPLNLSILGDHVSKFVAVPGIYDLDFKQVSDKFGRPILKLRSVEFVASVDFPTV
jgi:hypothetical protein